MTKSISDKLLYGLYRIRQYDSYARITEIIPNEWNWRGIASDLYERGLIEFGSGRTIGAIARLTSNGVKFCESTSFIDPSIPVIELDDL